MVRSISKCPLIANMRRAACNLAIVPMTIQIIRLSNCSTYPNHHLCFHWLVLIIAAVQSFRVHMNMQSGISVPMLVVTSLLLMLVTAYVPLFQISTNASATCAWTARRAWMVSTDTLAPVSGVTPESFARQVCFSRSDFTVCAVVNNISSPSS